MSAELVLVSRTPEETRKVAAIIARVLRPGDLVALTGELGAGKTCFVQGAAAALGVTERVTSPSFVLRREYSGGDMPILHMDIYRLETLQEVIDLGYEEIYDRSRVTFIEWGDAISPLLPRDHLELEFRLPDVVTDEPGEEDRRIVVRPRGEDWLRRLAVLAGDLQACVEPSTAEDPT